MNFIHACINNPIKVAVCVILTVMFGIISYITTPVQLTPEVAEPEITVTTRWPGASAQEVEREIIEEQEEQLRSVEGLREFKSESSDSTGTITLKFKVGTNMDRASLLVNNKLNQVPRYPENAQEPVINLVNTGDAPIAWFILKPTSPKVGEVRAFLKLNPDLQATLDPWLTANDHDNVDLAVLTRLSLSDARIKSLTIGKTDPSTMRKFAEEFLESRLERVPGVANANVFGGQEDEFRVIIDPTRLASHHLTIADVRRALLEHNKDTSGGDLWESKSRTVIRTLGQFRSADQVAEAILAVRDNRPVRVRDVATVGVNYKKPDGVVRQMGITGLALNAQQAAGSNVLQIMGPPISELDTDHNGQVDQIEITNAKLKHGDSLRVAIAEMNLNILAPRGLEMEQVYDQTEYIHSAKELVTGNIYVGGTLAVIVLLVFLRDIRSVLIIGVSIPISVIGTFVFIKILGRSINVISLAGMAFAVGMVVDNAIVVLENIYQHLQKGKDVKQATFDATTEVWGAVLSSTLTTLAVFIPIIFLEGQIGQLFRDIAIAISCAVGLSLVVSITVVPTIAQRVLRPRRESTNSAASSLFGLAWIGNAFCDLITGLVSWLQTCRFNWLVRFVVIVFFTVGSIWGSYLMTPKMEYLPEGNRNLVIALLLPPPGYNVNHMIEIGKKIEKEVAKYWEARPGSEEEKALNAPRIDNFFFVARGRMLFMGARSADPLRAAELVPVLAKVAGGIPGMIPIVSQASLFDTNLSGGRTIDIEITGPDIEKLVALGGQVFGQCMQEFPMDQGNMLRPIPSLDLSSPELHIRPRWERDADLGISAADLGYTVDALMDGAYVGDYWHNGRKIDLVVFGAEHFARHTQDVGNLPIATPSGELTTLSSVAEVKSSSGPEQLNHIERQRAITIQVKPRPGIPLEEALQTIEAKVRQPMLQSPEFQTGLYQIRMAGTADKLNETRYAVQGNLILAMLITYLLMAGLFESFLYPFVVMFSVALGLVGGFGGLALLNFCGTTFSDRFVPQALDTLTMLGFIILIGTVVNNAILIVEQALIYMRDEKLNPRDAVVKSTRSRIRPIFMTTTTTVLGMLPLVLPNPSFANGKLEWIAGAGSELYRGLGAVILGGLTVSTFFTLILIPVAFSLSLEVQAAFAKLLWGAKADQS